MAFILDSIPDFVAYVDAGLVYRVCNDAYSKESGQPKEAFVGKHVIEYLGEQGLAKVQPHVSQVLRGEFVSYEDRVDYRYTAEQEVVVNYSPHLGQDGSVKGFSVYVRNVTAQRRAEEVLRREAQYDPLTSLPNRVLFNKRLEQAISRARRISCGLAVLFIDLDGFKQINDQFGHDVGDDALRDVAGALSRHIRLDDTLARVGGDEFVLLLEDKTNEVAIEALARKVIGSVSSMATPAIRQAQIGASVGIAFFPDHASTARELMIRADEAMYMAKRRGKNRYYVFK